MRDGIYKNAPVEPWWKTFQKSCELKAEHGDDARDKGTRALLSDLSKAKIGEKITSFKGLLLSKQGALISPIESYSVEDAKGQCSRFMSDLLTGLKAQSALGETIDASSLTDAVEGALKSHVAAIVLEIKGHILSECSRSEAAEYMHAVKGNAGLIPFRSLASGIVAGVSEKNLKPKKSKLDLDDDIS